MFPVGNSRQQQGIGQSTVLIYRGSVEGGAELSMVEISRMRIGGISSPQLGGAWGLVKFSCSVIGGFCSDFSPKISIIWG